MNKLALLVAGLLSLTLPAQAFADTPIELKMEQFRRSVALRVEVGGKERLFQFDTGGGSTFISPEIAQELACEKGARMVGFRMTGDRLEAPRCDDVRLVIGGHAFTSRRTGVYQVGEFNAKGVTVDGLIALDVFEGRTVTLDFAGLKLIVETPESAAARIRGATEVPARLIREMGGYGLTIDAQVPSKVGDLGFELDSGNGGTLLIAEPYSALFGFPAQQGPKLGTIPLGNGLEASGLVFPAGITLDGNLGMPFLKYYIVTLDLERGRIWLQRNPVPPPPGMGVPPTEAKS